MSGKALNIVNNKKDGDWKLLEYGFVQRPGDIGYFPPSGPALYNQSSPPNPNSVLTVTAELLAEDDLSALGTFGNHSSCLGIQNVPVATHPKYRSITGYGNNLENPFWGVPRTTFNRFGPKNYDDGIHSVRKGRSGRELPNPRKLVTDVLLNTTKPARTQNMLNMLFLMNIIVIRNEVAQSVASKAPNGLNDARCCSNGNRNVLASSLLNSNCLPISVPDNDLFYKTHDVGCISMTRSILGSTPGSIEYGEIMNVATSFMDLSDVYGSSDADSNGLRELVGGRLRMGFNNTMPVNANGVLLPAVRPVFLIPIAGIWLALHSRQHNRIADGLKALNPSWDDEKLFQEARRINIALYQKETFSGDILKNLIGSTVNETYDPLINPSTSLEYTTASRFLHFFLNDKVRLNNGSSYEEVPLDSMAMRIDWMTQRFDDMMTGFMDQPMNFEKYSPEVRNFLEVKLDFDFFGRLQISDVWFIFEKPKRHGTRCSFT